MKSKVSCFKGEEIKECTRKSIEQLGGIGKFIKKNETVFIKPNLMAQFYSPYIVDADVIRTVIELCYNAGAKKVYVGENPMVDIESKEVLEYTGYKDYFEDAGAEVVLLDESKYVKVYSGNAKCFREFKLPEVLVKSDKYINIAKMKTHVLTGVTLCMKNQQGLLEHDEKVMCHDHNLSQKFVDMALLRKPNLCVVDAFNCLEGYGPMFGELKKLNCIVAGSDIISTDHACSKMMGFDPMEIKTTKLGYEQGVGNIKYKYIGPRISESFKKPWFTIPEKLGNIRFYSHIPDKGSENILKLSLSLFIAYSETFKHEFSKLKDLAVVYGGLNREIKSHTVLLFGDTAIKSKDMVKAKHFIEFRGNPPAHWLKVIKKLAQTFDLDIIGFMASALED